jgi:hypothetical protein
MSYSVGPSKDRGFVIPGYSFVPCCVADIINDEKDEREREKKLITIKPIKNSQ